MSLRDVRQWLRQHLPELLLIAIALFFTFRELGTFPDAWEDDSLFMIVARTLMTSGSYALPVLSYLWHFPYILAVGPTLIVPVALSMKLFGVSVAAARIPMALYLLGTTVLFYSFTERTFGTWSARLATGLLITLSAFVNTGKPVLGEIPAFFFLLLGLLALRKSSPGRAVLAGIAFGLAVVTKLSFAWLLMAIALAWIVCICLKQWKDLRDLTIAGAIAAVLLALWLLIEWSTMPGVLRDMTQYGFAGGGSHFFRVLREQPQLLLRFPYLYAAGLLVLAGIGLWKTRTLFRPAMVWLMVFFIGLFLLYFLNGPGWYRYILPAHLLALVFVPMGAAQLVRKRIAVAGILICIALQAGWQLSHQGSNLSDESTQAALVLSQNYTSTSLVFMQPEVFVRLPSNPQWQFISRELLLRPYPVLPFLPLTQEQHCLPIVTKLSQEDQKPYGKRITVLFERYVILRPQLPCHAVVPQK